MLPYSSIEEAEAALGRTLTYAETLWLGYSGTMSDYLLYCHGMLFVFIILTLAPLPLVLMELSRSPSIHRYKIQPHVRLSFSALLRCFRDVMWQFFVVVVPIVLVSYPAIKVTQTCRSTKTLLFIFHNSFRCYDCNFFSSFTHQMIGIGTGLPLPSGWEIFLQLLVYSTIEDYTGYWMHRWLHGKWGYDNIHYVHHQYTAPIGYALSAHWTEIVMLGIPSLLGPLIVPGHTITFWLWLAWRQIESIEIHSGYAFSLFSFQTVSFYVSHFAVLEGCERMKLTNYIIALLHPTSGRDRFRTLVMGARPIKGWSEGSKQENLTPKKDKIQY